MKARHLLIIGGVLLVCGLHALGSDVKVIANSSVTSDSISVEELKSVFLLQKKKLKDGSFVEPVVQRRGAVHDAFFQHLLKRDPQEIWAYYNAVVFTGKGSMPKELNSDSAVVAYVASSRGAIGYVSSSTSSEGVKVLTVVSGNTKAERFLLTRVEPQYPKELQQRGIAGTVRLALTVSPKGSVESVQIVGGNPILAEAAVKAAKQWKYSPAPSASAVEVSIPFEVTP